MAWPRVQTFSQNAQYSSGGAAATAAVLGSPVAIGDTILLVTTVGISGTTYTSTTPTVTDQLGNTYTRLTVGQGGQLQDATDTQSVDAWWCIVTVAGTPTVTYKANGTTSEPFIALNGAHFTGSNAASILRTSAGLVQTNPGTGTDAIRASASTLASQSGDLLWVCGGSAFTTALTAGTDFTNLTQDLTSALGHEYLSAVGAHLATFTDATHGGAAVYLTMALVISPATASAPIVGLPPQLPPARNLALNAQLRAIKNYLALSSALPVVASPVLVRRTLNDFGTHAGGRTTRMDS